MRDLEKKVLKAVGIGTLYVLAAPFYIPRWVKLARSNLALRRALTAGWIACPHCGERNPLNDLATCRRCGFTEFGSRLWCSNCKQVVARWVDCRRCRSSIKVW